MLLFSAQNYCFFLIFANISLFSSLYFSWKLRTIHAQYTDNTRTIHALFLPLPRGSSSIWILFECSLPSRHLSCFCQWSGKYPHLYLTLYPLHKKSPIKANFLAQSKIFHYLCKRKPQWGAQT